MCGKSGGVMQGCPFPQEACDLERVKHLHSVGERKAQCPPEGAKDGSWIESRKSLEGRFFTSVVWREQGVC